MRLLCLTLLAACGRLGFDTAPSDGGVDATFVGANRVYGKASRARVDADVGGAVALSADGTTLAVASMQEPGGAQGVDGNQDDVSKPKSGAVYVFVRSANGWAQQAYVKATNSNTGDQFGRSITLSADGNTLAVSANLEDNGGANAGAAYVYARTGTTWTPQAYLKAANMAAGDGFGSSISIAADGNTVAVGAMTTANGGTVYTFTRAGASWSQQATVRGANTEAGDLFGESVTLSPDGATLAVGAPLEASAATGVDGNAADNSLKEAGAAYVFTRNGSTWTQRAYIKPSYLDFLDMTGAYDQFGWSVALSSDAKTLAVGARLESSSATGIGGDERNNNAGASGAVYVFTFGTGWTQQAYIKPSNTGPNDFFGEQVALASNGSLLAVTSPFEDGGGRGLEGNPNDETVQDAGAVYLFERNAGTWRQRTYVKATNPGGDDSLSSVTLSGDGSVLAIGAPFEDSAATGLDGDQTDNTAADAGAFYIYY